jgi:hypothetical protein
LMARRSALSSSAPRTPEAVERACRQTARLER